MGSGRIPLLVAERELRIAVCIAYAPVTDRSAEAIASDATRSIAR